MDTSLKTGLKREAGFTLLEVVILACILGIVVMAVVPISFFAPRQTMALREKSFATEKAMQMMEELRSVVVTSNKTYILEEYDNGAGYSPLLTINKNVTDPADPLSGNTRRGGQWKYCRQISVINIPNNPGAKKVYVRIYKTTDALPVQPQESLADLISVLRVVEKNTPSTQVFDVYMIAIENVPGWWSALFKIKPIMDSIINDLQTRTPGLEVRAHWIRKLATGRDSYYTPYINMNTYSTAQSTVEKVYFYPGLMKNDAGNDHYYYHTDLFEGRRCVDGLASGSYSLADQYNNAVRFPEEGPSTGGEPSLRTLLEDMNSHPEKYMNAIFVNLHGELLPFPPLRNYSDAAKDPLSHPDWRLVVHPTKLQYNSTEKVNLRVYTYVMNPDDFSTSSNIPVSTIYFPGKIVTVEEIKKLTGSDTVNYEWSTAVAPDDYEVSTYNDGVSDGTLIKLKNSPLRHPLNNHRGLKNTRRLYDLEYIPCPVEDAADFSQDLTNDQQDYAKNTARWQIVLSNPGVGSKGYYEYDARIGDEWTLGVIPPPENKSRNYFWIDTTPPVTEQYQFTGDPRHCPYADVKLAHHYNWYFKQISGGGYAGFNMSENYWSSNRLIFDVPRMFSIYRQALQKTNSIWTSITGWSNYYIGIGGEMGADACNGFPSGLPINIKPWNPHANGSTDIDEITNVTNARLIAQEHGSWYSRWWLGELYPDTEYNSWKTQGNLNTGHHKYYRANYTAVGTAEFTSVTPTKRTGEYGCSSFFNGKPSSSGGPFRHISSGANGLITTEEKKVAKVFNFPLPATIQADRPFTLNYGSFPPEWGTSEYSAARTTLSTVETFYDNSSNPGSYDAAAQIVFENGTGVGYAILNGLAPQIDFGTAQMGKLAIVNALRGFMNLGLSSIISGRIPQLPRVDITSPNPNLPYSNPGTITIAWNSQWTRWDSELYTEAYTVGFLETEPIIYLVKYSGDNGSTWKYVQNNLPAIIGERTGSAYDLNNTSYTWSVSALPKGTYQLRVEAFRPGRPLHYSYHQVLFYLDN